MTTVAGVVDLVSSEVVVKIEPTAGGRIVSLVIGGVERILPKARARATTPPIYWGCYPMVPWPGRLAAGRIPTDDGEVRLEPNLPPAAIHGLGFDTSWDVVERTGTAVTMACDMRGLGWPCGGPTLTLRSNSATASTRSWSTRRARGSALSPKRCGRTRRCSPPAVSPAPVCARSSQARVFARANDGRGGRHEQRLLHRRPGAHRIRGAGVVRSARVRGLPTRPPR